MTMESALGTCPECGRALPADRRYVAWCQSCGWNADPTPAGRTEDPAWLLEREEKLAAGSSSGPEHSVGALLLAVPVLLVPLPGLLGGLALLAFYRPLWLSIPFAAIAFTLTAIFRPRVRRLPEGVGVVDRAPHLSGVLDHISTATGTPKVAGVVVTTESRIAVDRIGWRRRRILQVGLPAWCVLGPQERYAVLAHAMYEDQRSAYDGVISAARHVLDELVLVLQPGALDAVDDWGMLQSEGVTWRTGRGTDDQVLHSHLVKLGNAVFGPPVRAYRRLLVKLDLPGRQRREYRIDRRVAELAGSEPTARSLERVLLGGTTRRALERALRYGGEEPMEVLRRTAAEVPAHELARQVYVGRLRNTRSDAGHPPTWRRTHALRSNPTATTSVLTPVQDDELTQAARAAAADLRGRLLMG